MLKNIYLSFIFCLSTFTKIPSKYIEFDNKKMSYTYYLLPIVGLIIGLVMYLCAYILVNQNVEPFIICLILIVLNIFVTGGIHFDGLIDTLDAIKSYRSKEDKLRIISDSLIGAFALIYYTIYIIGYFIGYYYLVKNNQLVYLIIIPIIARLNIIPLINAKKPLPDDMLNLLLDKHFKKHSWYVWLIYSILLIIVTSYFKQPSIILIGVSLLYFCFYIITSKKHFDYINGDQCGYYIINIEVLLLLLLNLL